MVADLLTELLDLGGRRDGRNELLQGFLEFIGISNVKEQEVLIALRETEALNSCQSS